VTPSFGPGSVVVQGDIWPDGEVIRRATFTTIGESPHAQVKMYERIGGRAVEFDRLTEASIDPTPTGLKITGISDRLADEVGLHSSQAIVEWDVTLGRCPTC